MRASWVLGLALVFANVVKADEPVGQDPSKDESKKIEVAEKTTSVIVIMVDDKGNVIKKETVQVDKQGPEESPKTFRFDTKDGKLKIVMPDGGVKEIKRGLATRKQITLTDGEGTEIKESEVISDGGVKGVVTIDLRATDLIEQAREGAATAISAMDVDLARAGDSIRLELEKVIQQMELTAKPDVDQIADQIKAAIKQLEGVKAGMKGEMVVKFGDLDVIELLGDVGGKAETTIVNGENVVERQIRVARVVDKPESENPALTKIMEKLNELSTRLDKIEAKLEKSDD